MADKPERAETEPPFYGLFFCDTMSESESKKAKLASDGSDTFLAIGPFIMKEEKHSMRFRPCIDIHTEK